MLYTLTDIRMHTHTHTYAHAHAHAHAHTHTHTRAHSHSPVECIFDVRRVILDVVQAYTVSFIFGPEQWGLLPVWVWSDKEVVLSKSLVHPTQVIAVKAAIGVLELKASG